MPLSSRSHQSDIVLIIVLNLANSEFFIEWANIQYPIVHGFRLGPMGWELYANQYVSEENSYYVNDWLEL